MTNFTTNLRHLAIGLAMTGAFSAMADDASLAISVSDITSNDAIVNIVPSSDDISYYWNIATKSGFEEAGGVDKAVENRITIWERNASWYEDTSWLEMMSYDLSYGVTNEDIAEYLYESLMYDTDYVVYAFGMDLEGNVTVPVTTCEFRTLNAIPSDNTFSISINSITKGSFYLEATVSVVPSNDDTYMVRCLPKSVFEDVDLTPGSASEKEFILENMMYYLNKQEEVVSGPKEYSFGKLREDTEYCVVAMGLDENFTPSTAMTIYEFVAQEQTNPITESITLEVSDITPMNAHFVIEPSNDEILYYFNITSPEILELKGGVDNIPEKLIIDWWKYLAELYGGQYTWQDFMRVQTRTGTLDAMAADLVAEGEINDLYWGSDWVLYAVGFNEEGDVVTEPAVVYFSTPDPEESDMTFDFEFVSCEVDTNYPESRRGYYKVTVDIYPSNDEEEYLVNYHDVKYLDQYYEDLTPNMFEYFTYNFLPGAVAFTGPVRIVMPGLYGYDYYGEVSEYYLLAIGWNEGPTTELETYRFDCFTTGVNDVKDSDMPKVTVNGHTISLTGNYDKAAVYSLDGKVVGALRPGSHVEVPTGMYMVRYTDLKGVSKSMKFIVR